MKKILYLLLLLLSVGCRQICPDVTETGQSDTVSQSNKPEFPDVQVVNPRVKVTGGTAVSLVFAKTDSLHKMFVDVFLPDGYTADGHRYPVLYMHDGQGCLDASRTWNNQEWAVDETITKLQHEDAIDAPIVVCIYTQSDRNDLLMPANFFDFMTDDLRRTGFDCRDGIVRSPAMSHRYFDFICHRLKPYIDKTYATDTRVEKTAIMGSSMGALASYYAVQAYSDVFGVAMCLSYPSLKEWWDAQGKAIVATIPCARVYIDNGTADLDGEFYPLFNDIQPMLLNAGMSADHLTVSVYPGEGHNEAAWRRRLTTPLCFAFGK